MKSLKPHWIPFLALLALLTCTATAAWLPLGAGNLPVALAFGFAKAAIVVSLFMELKKDDTLLRLTSFVGLSWLLIMLILALSDYWSRFPGGLLHE